MTDDEFISWCEERGYRLLNDWNWQEIGGIPHYWIKNPTTNLYALIKEYEDHFVVLVEGFNSYGCFEK